ncbi:MAG: efflux RND transporter periplasmic adaptor subunit, partial [Candidatus Peribacteraceae bacterium]|nr:efflux RND transporter periplasmic adaptor subunit [Candidatus Peribacteraceae bacterium]
RRAVKIPLGVIIALMAISFFLGFLGGEIEKEVGRSIPQVYVEYIAPGLARSFTATGEVEAEKSANFIAEFKSTVSDIAVSVGDEVTKGQELMRLEAHEVEQKFITANAFYITTSQGLAQTRITAQQGVQDAQISLKRAQITLEKLQKENAAKRIQAEETHFASKLNFGLDEATAKTNLENVILDTSTAVHNALTEADAILEFSPEQEALDYIKETHIGVRDPAQKLFTSDAMINAYNAFKTAKSTYADSIHLLQLTEKALSMTLTTLHNSVTSPKYTIFDLNSNIEEINSHITATRDVISNLESTKRSLDSTIQKRGATSQVLIDAEAAYVTTMAELEASERKAELDVEGAKNTLNSAIASAKASEITALSNLTTAKGELEQARISRNELIIGAPFDGVVTDIPLRVGREIQTGEPVLTMENAEWLKIITFVSAQEVRHIHTGDEVIVDSEFIARVASVAPSADPASKKYKVEVRLGEDTLKPGSFVSLHFTSEDTGDGDDRIFLPVTSVHVSAAETFVWVLEEPETTEVSQDIYATRKQPVTIGDLSGKYVEILDGIGEGDRVIIQGGRSLTTEGQNIRIRQ